MITSQIDAWMIGELLFLLDLDCHHLFIFHPCQGLLRVTWALDHCISLYHLSETCRQRINRLRRDGWLILAERPEWVTDSSNGRCYNLSDSLRQSSRVFPFGSLMSGRELEVLSVPKNQFPVSFYHTFSLSLVSSSISGFLFFLIKFQVFFLMVLGFFGVYSTSRVFVYWTFSRSKDICMSRSLRLLIIIWPE